MLDTILPYAALIAVEEHLVHLFLIIFSQCLLLSSELGMELLKLLLLSLRCCPEILELLVQLIPLLLSVLAFGLYNFLFLSIRRASAFAACTLSCNSLIAFFASMATIRTATNLLSTWPSWVQSSSLLSIYRVRNTRIFSMTSSSLRKELHCRISLWIAATPWNNSKTDVRTWWLSKLG